MRPRASIGTAVVLIAVGGILCLAVDAPAAVERVVDVLDLGLILVWAGVLLLVMHVVMRPRGPRRPPRRERVLDERTNQWYEHDVHSPGYAGQTRRLPTIRDR